MKCTQSAGIYLATLFEYFASELLCSSIRQARANKTELEAGTELKILPCHVFQAVANDLDLKELACFRTLFPDPDEVRMWDSCMERYTTRKTRAKAFGRYLFSSLPPGAVFSFLGFVLLFMPQRFHYLEEGLKWLCLFT
jgi:hypothetical protein